MYVLKVTRKSLSAFDEKRSYISHLESTPWNWYYLIEGLESFISRLFTDILVKYFIYVKEIKIFYSMFYIPCVGLSRCLLLDFPLNVSSLASQ